MRAEASTERAQEGPRASKKSLRVWLRLLRTSGSIEKRLRARFTAEFDTTLPRFDVLAALERAPDGLSMGELSRALLVSNGNVTGLVARLRADGWVERAPAPHDRRAVRVRLTPRGRRAFLRMAQAHEGWVDAMLDGLSTAEKADLQALLDRLSAAIDAAPDQELN